MTAFSYSTLNDPLGTKGTYANGINDDSQIVGYYIDSSGVDHGFLYSGGTYVTLNDPSGVKTFAQGINDQGQIVGYYVDGSGTSHAFLYSGGTYTTLNGQSGIIPTEALGINDAGQIVGDYLTSGGVFGNFLYSGGTYTVINDQPGSATAINDAGQIVGSMNNVGSISGFIYSNGHFTSAAFSEPSGINDSGQEVGLNVIGPGGEQGPASFYSAGAYTTLSDPSAMATKVTGLNDAGQIVGYYTDSSGATHGFLAVEAYPQNPGNNDEWVLFDGSWAASAGPGSHPSGYNVAGVGDWTGDGTDGILWYDPTTGDTDEWQLSNTQWAASVDLGTHPGNYQIAGIGDFTGNSIDDALWTGTDGNGTIATDIWELNSNGKWAASVSPGSHPAGYSVAGTGDWTGNGTDGILWYNASTGDTDEWQLNNGQWSASVDLGSHSGNYQIAGIGDFFGNGRDDVLWTGVNSNGTVSTDIWELGSNGQWIASVSPGSHPAGYQVVGVGDFTGNGTSDILWYNASTGDTDEWLINNGQWAASIDLGTHPGNFQIAGVGDFNGAGNDGVLWHASS